MMLLVLGLIVASCAYLILTLVAAYGAATLTGGLIPLFGQLASGLAHLLPGAQGWHTVFDVRGSVGPVPSVFIALAVLFVPFFIAGFGIRSRIAYRRASQERQQRDADIARDEEVRQRVRERLANEQQRRR